MISLFWCIITSVTGTGRTDTRHRSASGTTRFGSSRRFAADPPAREEEVELRREVDGRPDTTPAAAAVLRQQFAIQHRPEVQRHADHEFLETHPPRVRSEARLAYSRMTISSKEKHIICASQQSLM